MLRFVLALLLLVPVISWAADGDEIKNRTNGRERPTRMYYLCDSKGSGDEGNDCPAAPGFRLKFVGASYAISVDQSANCNPYSIIIKDRALTGGDGHTIATLTNTTDTSLKLFGHALSEYVYVTLTTMTSCTDMDVILEVIE